MEYEIDDGEIMLFDKSTNPSLLRRRAPPSRKPAPARGPTEGRGRRKSAAIPEAEGHRV